MDNNVLVLSVRFPYCRPGTSWCTAQPSRTQLVSLTPRPDKIVENQGSVNTKVLASAGVVCILTNCLTVQGAPLPPIDASPLH